MTCFFIFFKLTPDSGFHIFNLLKNKFLSVFNALLKGVYNGDMIYSQLRKL